MWFNQLKRQINNMRVLSALRNIEAMGNIYYVFNSSNSYYSQFRKLVDNTYEDWTEVFHTSLTSAYAACTSWRNDVILLDWNSTHTLTEGLDWTKSRINVVGMDWGNRLVQQWAKIQSTDTAGDAYVIKITWTRNSFKNIKFIQIDTDAAALTVAQLWWEGNLYENCSFTFWVDDNLWSASAFEVVNGEDSWTFINCTFWVDDNLWSASAFEVVNGEDSWTFINCTFWADTLLTSEARAIMSVDQVTSWQEFKSNRFKGCTWMTSSSSSTATFIRLAAITDILFTNVFEDCNFVASVDTAWGAAVAEAVQTWTWTNKWTLLFTRPSAFNVTNVEEMLEFKLLQQFQLRPLMNESNQLLNF